VLSEVVEMDAAVGRPRALRISLVQALAAMVLAVAAVALPWATLKIVPANVTSGLRGGPLSNLLVVIAVVVFVLAALATYRSSRALDVTQVFLGCGALVVSIALALSKIASANNQALARSTTTQTAYAIGGPVAIAASLTIIAASTIGLMAVA
jgi:hypothetical protein